VQVVAVSDEPLVGTHADDDERVAALGAAESGMPLAADTDLLAVVDAPRNVDLELRPRHDTAVAAAVATRLLEHLARTLALRARRCWTNWPKMFCDTLRTTPEPEHVGHVRSTSRAPPPSQRSARTGRRRRAGR
jgi:hypothetical protein